MFVQCEVIAKRAAKPAQQFPEAFGSVMCLLNEQLEAIIPATVPATK